ncbi:MAG: hypothetical protein DWQ31_21170 [Planctomycetota bacterium]|nr:MAG: hypothetical protein DWQ31_21170 [Planctomycetota bacterium]REJ91211.1 MAG: hypothetical protein DWQ35_15105 [Planctomycetota bacterium]REK22212.1 MAG: hypothetical protein DWQ42_17810 [Planctomycetota bacterium]REK44266.1 MAG: hypothetical protein DWQ46_10245 [Planctomycetota bacterium]
MAKKKRARNPFYVLLVPVGVAFVVTTFCFGLMAFQQARPGATPMAEQAGLMPLLDRHGVALILVEVGLIALFTCGAIGTDEYWQRRAAAAKSEVPLASHGAEPAERPVKESPAGPDERIAKTGSATQQVEA